MRVLLISWHPESRSFNTALFDQARRTLQEAGHEVRVSDLHQMKFDPVSSRASFTTVKDPDYFKQQIEEMYATDADGFAGDVQLEIEKLEWCDLTIWVFPLWWFGLPAVFKGWVDRVFVMGRIYGGDKIYETGAFQGKKALLALTTGGPKEAYLKDGFNGDLHGILRPIHRGMLEFVGFSVLEPQVVYAPVRKSEAERQVELKAWADRLVDIEQEKPIDVGRY